MDKIECCIDGGGKPCQSDCCFYDNKCSHRMYELKRMKRSRIKRFFKVIGAEIRCDWYLLWTGMWRGECKFTGWNKNNQVSYIASTTGSIFDNNVKVIKVFFDERIYEKTK